MSLDTRGRDPAEQLMLDRGAVRDQERSADARADFSPLRERPPQKRSPLECPPGGELPREREDQDREQDREDSGERGKGLLRRHPVAFAVGLLLLLAALPIGYLYWDYTGHFEDTEDAYIASRQFAIAPEVSGYPTAVPVTDNEHVNAGGVIARIDDRTYRAALAQAEAQVAAANASIANIDAQIDVQQAQIAADQAQVNKAKAALVFAQEQASRYQYLAHTIAGTVQNAQAIPLAAATRPGYARQCASDS
jgi:membrane fusion protein (multidrug efflux system)